MISAAENEKNKLRIKKDFLASGSKITALVGLSKNAGKTSFLNWLTATLSLPEIGVITTGRDGEDVDLITKQRKPKVYLPANSFFSSWAQPIQKNSPFLTILEKLPYKAAGNHLWLTKTQQPLRTEVVGPATVSSQIQLAKKILSYGAKHVFIDGSLDRKSIVLAAESEQFFLIVSPAFGSLKQLIKEMERIVYLSQIPMKKEIQLFPSITYHTGKKCIVTDFNTLLGNEKAVTTFVSTEKQVKWLFIPGVITSRMAETIQSLLQKYNCSLYLENPFQLQVSSCFLATFGRQIFAKRKSKLCGIAVNSFSPNGNHLDSQTLWHEMQTRFPTIPVIDIYSL